MTDEDSWRGFLSLCLKAESSKKLDELFGLFLTPEEREDLYQAHNCSRTR